MITKIFSWSTKICLILSNWKAWFVAVCSFLHYENLAWYSWRSPMTGKTILTNDESMIFWNLNFVVCGNRLANIWGPLQKSFRFMSISNYDSQLLCVLSWHWVFNSRQILLCNKLSTCQCFSKSILPYEQWGLYTPRWVHLSFQ